MSATPRAGEAVDVTVSIVNHSSREQVLECLDSLARPQGVSLEVVVLDNASDDGSVAAIAAAFPGVRVIAQPWRAGFGANHNRVIRATRGRYVLVLNDDATVDAGALAVLVGACDEDQHVGAAAPRIVYPDGATHESAWAFPTPLHCVVSALTLAQVGNVQSRGSASRRVDWVSGSAVLFRRAALDRVGLFDEGYFMYMEETDLCRRLANAGYTVRYVPAATVVHAQWGSTGAVPERRIDELWRSRSRYFAKHHGTLGGHVARLADGVRYATGSAVAGGLARLPTRLQPGVVRRLGAESMRANAIRAFRGRQGPGLAELASEWNAAHGVEPERRGAIPAAPAE